MRRIRKRSGGSFSRRSTGEVKDLRAEAVALKELVADLTLENRLLKKSLSGEAANAIGPRERPNGGDQE